MYRKNLVFAAACLGMLLFGIVFLSLGSVNNMLAERFKLDDVAIGTLTALLPFGILVGSLIFGPVVDRFGYRWMLVGASLIVGLALEGMAFAGSKSLVQLFVFGIGFGGGILNGATNALAADVSEGERGAKLSLLGVFFGIGALAMPFTIATLSHRFAMSTIVAAIGVLVLAPIVFCLAIRFPPPKQQSERLTIAGGLALLGDPFLLFACLALAIQSGLEGMSNDWMTRYFKNVALVESESTEVRAQVALVVLTGTMTIVRVLLAGLLKRISARTVLLASIATTTLGAMVLMATTNYNASLVGVILIGAGLAAVFPVVLGFVGDCYPRQSGTAFSTIFVLALVGNMTVNKSFGYIAHDFGVVQYPKMLIGLLIGSAILLHMVCSLFAARTVR
jgi:FHS family glucose/mannose:H+ symporter-like MFS transporter